MEFALLEKRVGGSRGRMIRLLGSGMKAVSKINRVDGP
ncbi:hypothetical protein CZ787_01550 [Halomonas citrativorans]|uniref:Uncharacterized protein n=1 Tax=Halomonas citrativorans TaxID=2742612 RepID=A0A1R4HPI1_9GAMM|nr:hypothetical protein CZ787_01550 [Halomonas citrativorans]